MIIKYGTSENAEIIDAKNIPSWVAREPLKTEQVGEQESEDNTEEKE
jgi:hypothetical protein